jgi:cytochrome P450
VDTHDEGAGPLTSRFEVAAQPAGEVAGANVAQLHPQPGNAALAQEGATSGGGIVAVHSRELVDETLRNWANFSSENLIDLGNIRPMIPISIDPPDHLKYRKLLDPLFAPKRMDAIEADVAARVNRFIDAFEDRGSCNFTTELAEPFPSSVFLGLMGLPWSELETMMRLRDGLLRPSGTHGDARLAFQRATALEVYDFFGAILDERDRDPHDDILTLFLTAEVGGDKLTREEVLDICFLLLTAGLDTVTDSLTCFWAFLAQNTGHREHIVTDPDVIPRAVEELLRWETPIPSLIRWSKEACTVGGEEIAPGAFVSVNISAANVDEREFPNPLEVQFDREVNRHLTFGGGVHRCLGSHLARRELRVALREWHRRSPEYALAPGFEVAYSPPLRFVPDLQLVWG